MTMDAAGTSSCGTFFHNCWCGSMAQRMKVSENGNYQGSHVFGVFSNHHGGLVVGSDLANHTVHF